MEDIKKLEWLEIFLSYSCNYKCIFCFENKIRWREKKYNNDEILSLILSWYRKWKRFIVFSWWEPTLNDNLEEYISYSKKIWFKKIIIHTNWTKTSNFLYLKGLYNRWLTWIIFSFHWYWIFSNLITKNNNSFKYLNKSLINASIIKKQLDNSFTIDTNTVINKINVNNLFILFKYFSRFPITRRMLTFPYSMFWYSIKELTEVFPDFSLLLKELKKILDYSIENNIVDVVVEAIPYCFFDKKYWGFIEKNYRSRKNVFIPEDNNIFFIKNYHNIDIQHYTWWKVKRKSCMSCIKNNICLGISEDFLVINKDVILTPIL